MARKSPRLSGALLLGALAFAGEARANAGVGFFFVSVPFVVIALVPAILVEAPILSRYLRVTPGRGLWLSLIANLASTVLGAIIALAVDLALLGASGGSGMTMSRGAVLVSLVPMFLLTWWLESMAVRRMQKPSPASLATRATLVANATSYLLLGAVMVLVPSDSLDYPPGDTRARLSEAILAMGPAKIEVTEYFVANKRFPEPRSLPTMVKVVRSLTLERNGKIVAEIHYPSVAGIHGRHIVMEPVMESGQIFRWDCYTPDGAEKYLPGSCMLRVPKVEGR